MQFILFLALLQVESKVKLCGHDELKAKHPRSRFLSLVDRSSEWEPIRFAVDWSNLSDISKLKYEKYINAALDYYSNALKVHRLINPITWDESSFQAMCSTRTDDFYNKTISADFFIVITAEYNSNAYYIAGATACSYDDLTNQPITGYVFLNVAYLDENDPNNFITTITHEIAHALGFSVDDMPYYIKPDGTRYGETGYYQNDQARGDSVRYIITPNVVKRARIAFGCDSLIGLELETQGGPGSSYSHWNARIMKNEFMSPQADTIDFIYSDLTLALFEDSGWYMPDYSYGQTINFGYKKGCEFNSEKCIIDQQPAFEEFCVDRDAESLCAYDYVSKGKCKFYHYSIQIPNKYNYFNDLHYGGNQMADYCTLVYSNHNCRRADCPNTNYGEKYCDECRCVEGYYALNGTTQRLKATCHYIKCDGGNVAIIVGNEKVVCNESGALIDVPGYYGKLKCPNIDVVCGKPACLNNCYGGKCVNGACVNNTLNYIDDYNLCDGANTNNGNNTDNGNKTDNNSTDISDAAIGVEINILSVLGFIFSIS